MSVTIDIPTDLQPFVQAAIDNGQYADEKELVTELLRVAAPALRDYQQLKADVQTSLEQIDQGSVRKADFDGIRQQLSDERDEAGNQK